MIDERIDEVIRKDLSKLKMDKIIIFNLDRKKEIKVERKECNNRGLRREKERRRLRKIVRFKKEENRNGIEEFIEDLIDIIKNEGGEKRSLKRKRVKRKKENIWRWKIDGKRISKRKKKEIGWIVKGEIREREKGKGRREVED